MPTPLMSALIFLVRVLFGAYAIIVTLRLLLQTLRASYHNPLAQMTIRLTSPLVKPLQKILPGFKGIDFAVLALLLIVELVKIAILLGITQGTFPDVGGWFVWAIAYVCTDILDVFFFAILLGALLSWFPNMQSGPLVEVLELIGRPILTLIRRILPTIGGLDFSPLVALIVLQLLEILIFAPIAQFGYSLAML